MKKNLFIFVIRWLFNSLGLWVAVRLFGFLRGGAWYSWRSRWGSVAGAWGKLY